MDSAPLTVGTRYKVQFHQKRGSGADAVLEGFITPADTPFGAPFAQSVTSTFTTRADRVRVGSTTNSATTPPRLDALIDDVIIHGGPAAISTSPPYPPSNLAATALSAGQVNLTWTDTATNEASFTIERSTNGVDWTVVAPALAPNSTSYSDTTTSPVTTYQYRAQSTNSNGSSGWSNIATVTTPGVPPSAPTGLTATQVSPSRIDLAWTDTATGETGFVIERASDSAFSVATSIALPADTTTFSDADLASGVHWYRVRAVSDTAVSAWAGPVRGSRIKDMTFEAGSLTGSSGATKVASSTTVGLETSTPLKGTASARIPMGTAAAYLEETFPPTSELFASLYLRPGPRGTADVRIAQIVHGTVPSEVTAGSFLLRANGTIQLRNYNTTIGSGPVLTVGVTYRLALHQRMLGNGLLQLEAYVAQGDAAFGAPFASTTTATIATTTGAGTFRVGATGSAGGLDAVIDDVKLDTASLPAASGADQLLPPLAPSGLAASAISASQISLSWNDTATDETSFAVQRSTDGVNWTVAAAALPANTTTFADTGLTSATTYQYRVSASNANGTSAWSNVASASTAAAPPSAPTGLAARQVSINQIDLSWTDTSATETGFVLERASDSTFADVTSIALPADATAYSDVGVAEGVHWYRLKAVAGISASAWTAPVRGSRIKEMTFEAGSLTGPSGATKVATAATVGLETGSPLKGAYSARIPMGTAAAYLEENFAPENELFASFFLRPGPRGTVDVRVAQTLHGTGGTAVTAGSLLLKANGQIQLRNNNTLIGSGPILVPGVLYRVGLHQRMLTGGALQLEAFVAEGDATFGGAFAATTTATISTTTGAGTFRVGATGTAGGLDATVDSVAIDSAVMPSASAGAALSKPPAPTGLTANTIAPTQVDLAWTDQATNENSFIVERSTGAVSWTVVASLPPEFDHLQRHERRSCHGLPVPGQRRQREWQCRLLECRVCDHAGRSTDRAGGSHRER